MCRAKESHTHTMRIGLQMTTLLNQIPRHPSTFAVVGTVGLTPDGCRIAKAFAAVIPVLLFDLSLGDAKPDEPCMNAGLLNDLPPGVEVTKDPTRLKEPGALIICVRHPLASGHLPDPSTLCMATQGITRQLRPGQLLVVVGTTPPGTTRAVLLPLLTASGLTVGRDFSLAYSAESEEIGEGSTSWVVGGFDEGSTEAASALFSLISPLVTGVSSLEAAELCGMVGSLTRAVHTAVANEMRTVCDPMQIDVWEVLNASRPGAFPPLVPGCSSDDFALDLFSWGVRRYGASARLIESARVVNSGTIEFVMRKLEEVLNHAGKPINGSKILIVGIANKPSMDPRGVPAFKLLDLLVKKGGVVTYEDPLYPELPWMPDWPEVSRTSVSITRQLLEGQDCVLMVTNRATRDYQYLVSHSRLIIDACNATKNVIANREKITRI